MIVVEPGETPVTTPDDVTVAADVVLLVQLTPPTLSLKVML